MSDATETLKVRLAISRARLEMMKAKQMSGGYSRHPSGSSKGGQFAPKGTNSFGNPSDPAPFKSGGNTFIEVGGPGWGSYQKPKGPPPGAKPHPAGMDDKGNPVTVNYPTKPSSKDTWSNKDATATFVPGGDAPSTLNGVSMKSWSPPKEGWHAVGGNNERLEALFPFERPTNGKSTGAGVLIVEPDGRIWLTKPTNEFGGYKQTYPKGTVESGLTMQQNAIKEAYEETGLKIKITGVLGDYDRTTSRARMYIAEREGGTPKDMGWESQAVRLSSMKDAKTLLNMSHDKKILQDLEDLIAIGKSKGGSWQNQARWPSGSSLGGQWKAMGADGLTLPPLIAGGLEGKNAAYQKAVNAAHAAAQKGDTGPVKQLIGKYITKADAFAAGQKGSSHIKWGAQATQYGIQLLKDATFKPVAAATADRIKGPDKLSDMGPPVGPKPGGSNPGALYNQGGDTWLVKGSNAAKNQDTTTIEDRSKNEVLAAKLMLAVGVGAPDMKLVQLGDEYNGGLGVASKWVDGLTKLNPNNALHIDAAQQDFAVHAWLANYDVLGTGGFDNTSIKDGKAINIDTGGALLFRAQGEKKGAESGVKDGLLKPDAPEFESMRGFNSEQKTIYGSMTASQLASSAEKLNNISNDTIKSLVKTYGPGDDAFKEKLAQNLIDRKNAVLQKAGLAFNMKAGESVATAPKAEKPVKAPASEKLIPPAASAFKGDKADIKAEIMLDWKALHDKALTGDTTALKNLKQQTSTSLNNIQHPKPTSMSNENWKDTWTRAEYAKVLLANLKANLNPDGSVKQAAPAVAPQVVPTPPKKEEVEAEILAAAMKEVKLTTTSINNKVAANPNVNIAPPSGTAVEKLAAIPGYGTSGSLQNIAATIDKSYAAGDLSSLAMAKVGIDKIAMAAAAGSGITKATTALTEHTLEAMDHLAFKSAKDALNIAAAAPKIDVPPKPVFPNAKTGSKYYNGLADKAEKLAAAGDLAGLKALGTSGTYAGGVPWKPGTANGKVMASYHSALVATLEQKDAAGVVAGVQQAQRALEKPAPVPTPIEAAQKALPAMPNFAKEYYASSNVNAPSHNKKVAVIEGLAAAGDVKGLLSLNYATNTMGKAQAKLANNVLAALGASHVVTAGQKANSHPALFGGVTAAQATAAAAKVNVAPATTHPAAKPKQVINANLLPEAPKFITSNAAVKLENEGHAAVLTQLAKDGDLVGLKAYSKFSQQSQKLTSYKQELIESVESQMDAGRGKSGIHKAPPIKPAANPLAALSAHAEHFPPVLTTQAYSAASHNKIAGWVLLGKTDPATIEKAFEAGWNPDPLPSKLVSAHTKVVEAASLAQQDDISRYVGNWSYGANDRMRNKGEIDDEIRSVSKTVSALAKELPPGTRLKRNMDLEGAGLKALLGAQPGDIIQSPQFESTANPTGHYGEGKNVRLNLITAPGVRGVYVGKKLGLGGENEMILPENTRYAIRRVYKKGHKTIVEAIILPSVLGRLE